jgi:hypothetical protein
MFALALKPSGFCNIGVNRGCPCRGPWRRSEGQSHVVSVWELRVTWQGGRFPWGLDIFSIQGERVPIAVGIIIGVGVGIGIGIGIEAQKKEFGQ